MHRKQKITIEEKINHLFDGMDKESAGFNVDQPGLFSIPPSKFQNEESAQDNEQLVKPVFKDFIAPSPEPDKGIISQQTRSVSVSSFIVPFGYRINSHQTSEISAISKEKESAREILLRVPFKNQTSNVTYEAVVKLTGVTKSTRNRNFAENILNQLASILRYSDVESG
jgi:hypothetical protein